LPSDRFASLRTLRELGFEVGSGIMVGIPGQTISDLAGDIELFAKLDLDMIGVGPYIAHPDTPLGRRRSTAESLSPEQARSDELTTYKVMALARLVCPRVNLPCTSALATLNGQEGRILGLERGGNVIMPNLTPAQYRKRYQIYPSKIGFDQTPAENDAAVKSQISRMGRRLGKGRGDSPNRSRRS
jgi:biotin synthase